MSYGQETEESLFDSRQEARHFSSLETVLTGSDTQPILYSLGTCGYFPGLKAVVKGR
jgi:hypothetical protein